jgi:capsular polysaccharide biosynthesis protein
LSLVEPANLPDRPFSPNRPVLIAGGAAAGLALGLLLVLALELLTKPIRSPRQLEALGVPVLGVVPFLDPKPRARRLASLFSREKRLAA